MTTMIDIDTLIEIVSRGGKITTGIDIYNEKGILLLNRDILVTSTKLLKKIKENGIKKVPLSTDGKSGIWDADGNMIKDAHAENDTSVNGFSSSGEKSLTGIEKHLRKIEENRKLACESFESARKCIKKAFDEIRQNSGQFDFQEVSSGVVQMTEILTGMDNPFSCMSREIFSHDDYLYNHSINVCAIGTIILNKFNSVFSNMINRHLNSSGSEFMDIFSGNTQDIKTSYLLFQKDEIQNISLGFFLHDIGKLMVPDEIMNKSCRLTDNEFNIIKKHSFEFGLSILEKNKIDNPFIKNIVQYHHGPLYKDEERCYPLDILSDQIPVYARICKLADIYDAMTSKRCYKEAFNQINAVTDIVRSYAKKDMILQYILQAFIKGIGIYPPGSIVFLRNGQMGYVLDSKGPFIIPFTDTKGNGLSGMSEPIDLSDSDLDEALKIDSRRSIKNPCEVYELLPQYLRPEKTGENL